MSVFCKKDHIKDDIENPSGISQMIFNGIKMAMLALLAWGHPLYFSQR